MMDRRELLRAAATMLGTSLSPGLVAALDQDPPPDFKVILSAGQLRILTRAVDLLLPATDTPGALDAEVPAFMHRMIATWLPEDERAAFMTGLDDLDANCRTASGTAFEKATDAECVAVMEVFDRKQIFPFYPSGRPLPFFARFKELAVVGYCTSEIGATQALRYLPAPGRHEGCVPYRSGERAFFYTAF